MRAHWVEQAPWCRGRVCTFFFKFFVLFSSDLIGIGQPVLNLCVSYPPEFGRVTINRSSPRAKPLSLPCKVSSSLILV
ncbi:hypothetical protein P692DRAFT_20453972 [Suillus brevipes Sb2]|nr:hypothetical protein P692DRAFT_20453972 [Suillus brevipes Sb2]